jgi:hypothetical protein
MFKHVIDITKREEDMQYKDLFLKYDCWTIIILNFWVTLEEGTYFLPFFLMQSEEPRVKASSTPPGDTVPTRTFEPE